MAAENFNELIKRVQLSGLNYKIEMSPFSAKVFLKKTFTKDINGNPVKTQCSTEPNIEQITAENKFLNNKVFQLESSSNSLASQYEHTRLGYQHVYQTNVNLLQKVENLQAKLSAAEEENVKLMLSQEERNTEKDNFQLEHQLLNQSLMEEVERLSSQLSGSKVEAIKEIEEVQKQAKQEIKGWKKELGRERSMKINLENKLKLLSVENELVKEKPLMQIELLQAMLLKRKLSVPFVQNPFPITNLHSLLALR